MSRNKALYNPFYVLLLVAGLAFVVTACAYGVMAFRGTKGETLWQESPGLLVFLDRHGALVMGIQIGVLAVASAGAMLTDNFWKRRAERYAPSERASPPMAPEKGTKAAPSDS
jgi:integral membrane sensor domain MASE1